MLAQELPHLATLLLPAHERRDRGGERIRRTRRHLAETRILAKDQGLELPYLARRIDPEIVAKQDPQPLVGGQRIGAAIRPVERQHELPPEPLAQRVLGHQCLELRDHLLVVAHRQVGINARLGGGEVQLLQPNGLADPQRAAGQVGQRRTSPEIQPPVEQPDGPPMVAPLGRLAAR